MRFLKLLAEVGVGLGTFLNGYCGPSPSSHGISVGTVCETWGHAVDTLLYNIEYVDPFQFTALGLMLMVPSRPEILVTKGGSVVSWGILKAGNWRRCVKLI